MGPSDEASPASTVHTDSNGDEHALASFRDEGDAPGRANVGVVDPERVPGPGSVPRRSRFLFFGLWKLATVSLLPIPLDDLRLAPAEEVSASMATAGGAEQGLLLLGRRLLEPFRELVLRGGWWCLSGVVVSVFVVFALLQYQM